MVLAILVETTSPIRVLRMPGFLLVLVSVVSAMAYFFSVAADFLVAAFFAVATFVALGAAAFLAFGAATAGFVLIFLGAAGAAAAAFAPLPPASCFSRWMVYMRAMS